jgi:hypothetical protein
MGGTSTVSIPGVTVRGLGLQLTSNRIVDPTRLGGPDGPSNVQQIVTPAQLASTTGFGLMSLGETSRLVLTVVKPITDAAIANLNLGDGEYLAVSETRSDSDSLPGPSRQFAPTRGGIARRPKGHGLPTRVHLGYSKVLRMTTSHRPASRPSENGPTRPTRTGGY